MADITATTPAIDPVPARREELANRAAHASTREQAKVVANEFERMFLSEMLKPMFQGLKTEAPFGGGASEEMFRPMLIDQYAAQLSKAGGIGVADAIMGEILRMQGLEP
jgi:Rod binding domain-containing protein